MSFEPNERQALLLWTMITGATPEERQPMVSAARPELAPRDRNALVDHGFLERTPGKSKKGARANFLSLTDKAWEWASHAHEITIMRSQFASNALQGLLRHLVPFLERRDIALADLFRDDGPAFDDAMASPTNERSGPQEHPPAGVAAAPISAEHPGDWLHTRVEQACLSLAGGSKKSRVRLSALRRALPAIPRNERKSCAPPSRSRRRASAT